MKTAIIESSKLQFAVRDYFITKERPSTTILQILGDSIESLDKSIGRRC